MTEQHSLLEQELEIEEELEKEPDFADSADQLQARNPRRFLIWGNAPQQTLRCRLSIP